jgi:hypothetical protein
MSVTFTYLGCEGADKRERHPVYEGKSVKVGGEVTFNDEFFVEKARKNPEFQEIKAQQNNKQAQVITD